MRGSEGSTINIIFPSHDKKTNLFYFYFMRLSRLLLTCLSLCALSACGEKNDEPVTPDVPEVQKDTFVFAVGEEPVPGQSYYYATIWRDGNAMHLSDGTFDSFCNGAAIDGHVLYVVGDEATGEIVDDGYYEPYKRNVGVMWTINLNNFDARSTSNVTKVALSDGKNETSPLKVAVADSKVYVSGFDYLANGNRRAIVWTDGKPDYLTDGSVDALAYCIAADGSDYYAGGYIQSPENMKCGTAVIWKNGEVIKLTDGSTLAKVTAICAYTDKYGVKHLFAAGSEKNIEGRWKGVLWIDGKAQDLTGEEGTSIAAMSVTEDGYYIVGNKTIDATGSIVACLWTKDGCTVLSKDDGSMVEGSALTVVGKDVYVVGSEAKLDKSTYDYVFFPHVWKNGVEQDVNLSEGTTIWSMTSAIVEKQQ